MLKNRGHAFRLLTIIAESARRESGSPDGLKIGEAFVGGHKKYGMSQQNYRSAKKTLVDRQHIVIVETSRTRKKSPIKNVKKNTMVTQTQHAPNTKLTNEVTTDATRVKLLSSDVWDINIEEANERGNERLTNDQRTTNDKQERKKDKNERKEQPLTPSFSQTVFDLGYSIISILKKTKADYAGLKNSKSLQNFYSEIDRMLRIDKRTPEKILQIFEWALGDSFWSPYFFKPNPAKYLREKFDIIDKQSDKKPKERRFAPCSDDKRASEIARKMVKDAI